MSGFQKTSSQAYVMKEATNAIPKISEIPWSEVENRVRQARALRTAYIADWLKRTAESWRSVFRRPGHQLPHANYRWRPSTQ